MKLVEFSVERYRSIIQKSTIQIKDKTVIIGPNNEGKSNVLRALVVAQRVLEAISSRSHPIGPRNVSPFYILHFLKLRKDVSFDWDNDYPHSLLWKKTEGSPIKPIIFCMLFSLSEKEQEEFVKFPNIKQASDKLYTTITIYSDYVLVSFSIGEDKYSKGIDVVRIARFITKHISVCYIDAVRTASTAYDSIHRLLSIETESIDESEQYQQCIQTITNLYNERFEGISGRVTKSLNIFVPNIRETHIELPKDNYEDYNYIDIEEDVNVSINDGETTLLEQKGSGIQSLIALALAHSMSIKPSDSKNFVLAIEEPEAHLHPKAIHEIKKVLSDIACRNQLVITTHSPLLANIQSVESNIIVSANTAHPAASLKQIREALGVLASDNLLFADNTILVEGLSDKLILEKILASLSAKIAVALREGTLMIYNCQGCSKISAFVSIIKSFICRYYIVLDNDEAGQDERKNLVDNNPNISKDITCFATTDMIDSEIEDFIEPEAYVDEIIKLLGFGNRNTWLNVLNGSYKSWSDRLNEFATGNGHPISKPEMIQAKIKVANVVVDKGLSSIIPSRKAVFDTLAENIEKMLDE